jgi:hypothetical protein
MPRKNAEEWQPDERGRYRRMVGWIVKGEKRQQYPFYFGTNLDQAKARLLRVKELWAHLTEHKKTKAPVMGFPPTLVTNEPEPFSWDEESLWVARALADGRVQILVERARDESPDGYVARLSRLGKLYPMVYFVPEDREKFDEGSAFWRKAAEHQVEQIRRMPVNVVHEVSETLYDAIDKYIEHVKTTDLEPTEAGPRLTGYGVGKIEQALRIKERQKNLPLSQLDFHGCQALLDFWRLRPLTKARKKGGPQKPMTKKTCENHIAELMRLFRWISKSNEFRWRKPEDFDELRTDVRELQEERTSIGFLQVRVYGFDDLKLLNKYATPLERLLLLLGLNCGFKGAEQGTLLLDHIFLDRPHPNAQMLREVGKFECLPDDKFVLYSRNKSKVYGEFLLWRQTAEGIRWAVARQEEICKKLSLPLRHLLVTKQGKPFYRRTEGNKNRSQIFSNKWGALTRRIRKDHPDFPVYPFSTLRDTGANLVRNVMDGEVSAVYLCHGNPVKKDNLLELYTNRPFGKLFKTLRQIEEELRPVFGAAPENPWEQPMQQYTTLNKRERMLALSKTGLRPSQIAKEVGVSKMTVLRLLKKHGEVGTR